MLNVTPQGQGRHFFRYR